MRTIEHGDARAISLRRAVRPRGRPTLEGLREAAAGCTGCHLYQRATQTVFGEGDARARVMLGPRFRVTQERGRFVPSPLAQYVLATVHPSALLRAPDDETRHREMRRFVDDLRVVAEVL